MSWAKLKDFLIRKLKNNALLKINNSSPFISIVRKIFFEFSKNQIFNEPNSLGLFIITLLPTFLPPKIDPFPQEFI